MKNIQYYELPELEQVYLEDSFVLGIDTTNSALIFEMEIVLRESHPLYYKPLPDEQYCYCRAALKFSKIERIEWVRKDTTPSIDAAGEIDYGNIDVFFVEDKKHYLRGDWGEVNIYASELSLTIHDSMLAGRDSEH